MNPCTLSVDLGGTSLRLALVDTRGQIVGQHAISSDLLRSVRQVAPVLIQECQNMQGWAKAEGLSIEGASLGIPGLVDARHGIIYESPHFPEWREVPLKLLLQPQFDFPVLIDNDANQAALGEAWLGAGRHWPDFALLTLGTGVGAGFILNGQIFHGPSGFAGEVGHMTIDWDGLPGALGILGTLETLASQSGLRLQLRHLLTQAPHDSDFDALGPLELDSEHLPELLARLAQAGNPVACGLWAQMGKALACVIAALCHSFGFFRFVLGGGLAAAWDLFYGSCLQELPRRLYASLLPHIQIAPTRLGGQAGLLGGARKLQLAKISRSTI